MSEGPPFTINTSFQTHSVNINRSTRDVGTRLETSQITLTINALASGGSALPTTIIFLYESWGNLDTKSSPVISVRSGSSGDFIDVREYVDLESMNVMLQGFQAGTMTAAVFTYDGQKLPDAYDPADISSRPVVQVSLS